jgi:hypothetical protein
MPHGDQPEHTSNRGVPLSDIAGHLLDVTGLVSARLGHRA